MNGVAAMVKKLRAEQGWSQADLAKHGRRFGIERSYIAQLETLQIKRPSAAKCMALAKTFGVAKSLLLEAGGYVPTMTEEVLNGLAGRLVFEVVRELAELSPNRQRDLLPVIKGMRRR
jgi:transcriptional regulator with XRE-family HTH domain